MRWPAVDRFGLSPAPGSLGAVHEFLSTSAAGTPREPDLLAGLGAAQAWLDAAWPTWQLAAGHDVGGTPALDAGGLRRLRRLRDAVRRSLDARDHAEVAAGEGDGDDHPVSASVVIALGPDGAVTVGPPGAGAAAVIARLLLEIRDAQASGTWVRIKTCRNPRCRGVFYDRSRNNSGVWHDVRTCGNVANLRASRARRRESLA